MAWSVHGHTAYAYTGGKPFDPALPVIVLVHGAQNDHSVWALQSRYLAHHGYAVLAPDLPGHGRSGGPAMDSVEALAGWLLALLDAAGCAQAMLAGHSMGSLIALEAAARAPQRVRGLALLGTAVPMAVSDALLATARDDEARAINMVALWSHASAVQRHPGAAPGVHGLGAARALMRRMGAINPARLLHNDFNACNRYANGLQAAAQVRCPTLLVSGLRDVMTPPRATAGLLQAIPHARTVRVDAGHAMMAEQPDAVLDALTGWAKEVAEQKCVSN